MRHASSVPQRLPLTGSFVEDEALESRWTNKLIDDLQRSATDESAVATLAELRSSLALRAERQQDLETNGEADRLGRHSAPGSKRRRPLTVDSSTGSHAPTAGASHLVVPRYNPGSVSELQKAAQAAAMPEQVKGPLPQLVRDMNAALTRQQVAHEALQKRLAQLQPPVLNYDPKDVTQLTKAVGEATSTQGPEVSGALPKLLKDVSSALAAQQQAKDDLEKRLRAASVKRERTSKQASTLRSIVLRNAPVNDRLVLLFEELSDRCTVAVEEAAHLAGTGDTAVSGLTGGEGEGGGDMGRWQDTLTELRTLVTEQVWADARPHEHTSWRPRVPVAHHLSTFGPHSMRLRSRPRLHISSQSSGISAPSVLALMRPPCNRTHLRSCKPLPSATPRSARRTLRSTGCVWKLRQLSSSFPRRRQRCLPHRRLSCCRRRRRWRRCLRQHRRQTRSVDQAL